MSEHPIHTGFPPCLWKHVKPLISAVIFFFHLFEFKSRVGTRGILQTFKFTYHSGLRNIFFLARFNAWFNTCSQLLSQCAVIIISAERHPLTTTTDIGVAQVLPQWPVLCFSHTVGSCDFHLVFGHIIEGLPTLCLPVRGNHPRTLRIYRTRGMCLAHCFLSLAILRTMSVTLVLLRISSLVIR